MQLAPHARGLLLVSTQLDPHLVIIDLDMPGMRGHHVVHHLRLQDSSSLAMVVGLASKSGGQDHATSAKARFDVSVVKPLGCETLTDLIEKAMSKTLHLRTIRTRTASINLR